MIIIGCNHVNNFIVPDYNIWGSVRRWKQYGHFVNKKSILVVPPEYATFSKKMIRKVWKGKYETYDTEERLPGLESYKTIYDCFKNVGLVSIFWAYQAGASKISIVGMDGYTFYKKKDLKSKLHSQHCTGKGQTDGQTYGIGKKKDNYYRKRLKGLHRYGKEKYGFEFKILTPTVFKKYYNSRILDIG